MDFYQLKPDEKQLEVLLNPARTLIIAGGERRGKSWLAAAYAATRLPFSQLIWIVGPDYAQARAEFDYLIGWIRDRGGLMHLAYPQEGPAVARVSGGKIIETKSGDDIKKIASKAPDLVILSEAAQHNREIFDKCYGRVAEKRGNLLAVGTFEEGAQWYEQLFLDFELMGRAVSMPSWDNHIVYPGGRNDPEIKILEKIYGKRTFQRRIAGEVVPAATLVYDCYETSMVAEPPGPPYRMVIAGVDWGFGDPTAIEVFGLKDLTWYGLDEFYEPHQTSSKIKVVIDRFYNQHGVAPFHVPHDKPEIVAEYHQLGGKATLVQTGAFREVMKGIAYVYGLMETGRLKFSPKQKELLHEIRSYVYPTREAKNKGEKPVDAWNHACDAVRMCMVGTRYLFDEMIRKSIQPVTKFSTDVERAVWMDKFFRRKNKKNEALSHAW